jgi:endogenous inhibitor of DNA gyrase (YacG/DUF329 family)
MTPLSKGWPMSSMMIRCPTTGRPVSTAIEIEPSVFRKLPNLRAHMLCPACGQEHGWMTKSAWLAGEPRLVEGAGPASETGIEAA